MIGLCGLEFGAAFGDDQRVAADHLCLEVRREMEALDEKVLQARLEFVGGQLDPFLRFGFNVVEVGVEPRGLAGDLIFLYAVGQLYEELDGETVRIKTADAGPAPVAVGGVGLV